MSRCEWPATGVALPTRTTGTAKRRLAATAAADDAAAAAARAMIRRRTSDRAPAAGTGMRFTGRAITADHTAGPTTGPGRAR